MIVRLIRNAIRRTPKIVTEPLAKIHHDSVPAQVKVLIKMSIFKH